MTGRTIAVSVAILFLTACETDTPPQPKWQKPGADAAAFEAARDECVNAAEEPNLGVDRSRHQIQGRGNVFMRCMRDKGWEQVPGTVSE